MADITNMTYQEALEFVAEVYDAPVSNIEDVLRLYNADVRSAEDVLAWFNDTSSMSGAEIKHIKSHTGSSLGTRAVASATLETNPVNSNVALKRATEIPIASKVEVVAGNAKATFKTGIRETGKFIFGDVVPAICAAGVGVSLGKTFDSLLYNVSPDFWDSLGLWSMNPDTWNSLCTDDSDALDQLLLPVLFGIDGRNTQAYVDQDALAYMAMWMAQHGVFSEASYQPADVDVGQQITKADAVSMNVTDFLIMVGATVNDQVSQQSLTEWLETHPEYAALNGTPTNMGFHSHSYLYFLNDYDSRVTSINGDEVNVSPSVTATGYIFTYNSGGTQYFSPYINRPATIQQMYTALNTYGYPLLGSLSNPVEGIGDQTGAVLPDTTGWNDTDSTLQSLQNQYPDMWNNAKHYDYVDENGNNKSRTYVPINMPKANNKRDKQPTSGDEKQSKPQTDTDSPTDLQDLITQIITNIPARNPDPTGSGDAPPTVIPTGSASSLWAVYNPTQAELDSFGAWLWSSNLVEQIKKLFNDPMQAIIGVHKVFATPATGAAQNIKCGYIDSGVPASVVTSQYSTVNCGTVKLREYFENVFDYSPFTEVSLYLPFIGIVKLDVGDVMRASIEVKYHVDVITGACLADVIVNRDGAGGVLYQYAGSAIVTYPISSGSYASAVGGILSIAGGIAATVLTGGAAAPAVLGAAAGISHLHSDVQKSGSFTGAAGAMGGKTPYLIISRPQTGMPSRFAHLQGYPVNYYTKLGNCSGHVKISDVQVKGVNATDTELDMIRDALLQGVEI